MASTVQPEESRPLVSAPARSGTFSSEQSWKTCCCACCVVTVAVLSLGLYGVYRYIVSDLTNTAIARFVTLHDHEVHQFCGDDVTMRNLAEVTWWPGCGTNFTEGSTCGEPCFTADFLQSIIDFNRDQNPGRIVAYPSRPGVGANDKDIEVVTLRGWLLEASRHSPAHHKRPRIVIQHGFTSNSNKFRVFLMGVILRQLGFDVLLNNFRDHCYSDDSEIRIIEWGHAYPYDLLGAWDYLRKDPHGHLGGELDADRVGMVGISMGAFNTVNAFGMEGDVPAAWVDAPPSTPKSVFSNGALLELEKMGIGFLHDILVDPVWQNCEEYALANDVDLNEHLPEKVLPRGPNTTRPFTLVGNHRDTTVPIQEVLDVTDIAKSLPEKYDAQMWAVDDVCLDSDHCVDHLSHFKEYKAKLCKFWYKVFDLDTDRCPEDVETPAMHHP